jgi:hypothetical protein
VDRPREQIAQAVNRKRCPMRNSPLRLAGSVTTPETRPDEIVMLRDRHRRHAIKPTLNPLEVLSPGVISQPSPVITDRSRLPHSKIPALPGGNRENIAAEILGTLTLHLHKCPLLKDILADP